MLWLLEASGYPVTGDNGLYFFLFDNRYSKSKKLSRFVNAKQGS